MTRFFTLTLILATTPFSPTASAVAQPVTRSASLFVVGRTGSGQPMILILGLLSSGEVWKATVEHFRDDYDMHVLTIAGFAGAPPTSTEPFLAAVRDEVIQYIREKRLEQPVLVGHSLGGFLSLWIAATAPELVGPVVAVDGVAFLPALADSSMTPERARAQAEGARAVFAGMSAQALAAQTRSAWHAAGARWGLRQIRARRARQSQRCSRRTSGATSPRYGRRSFSSWLVTD